MILSLCIAHLHWFILVRCQSGSVFYLTQTLHFSSDLRAAANCEQCGRSDADGDATIVHNSYLLVSYLVDDDSNLTCFAQIQKRNYLLIQKPSCDQQNISRYIIFIEVMALYIIILKGLCSYLFVSCQQIQLHYMYLDTLNSDDKC